MPPSHEQFLLLLRWLQNGPPGALPLLRQGLSLGFLQAVTWEDAGDPHALRRLADWHASALSRFEEHFPVDPASVRRWLVDCILSSSDRLLFWVKDVRGGAVGHVGLVRIDPATRTAAVADVVCGVEGSESLLSAGTQTLVEWAQSTLDLEIRPGASTPLAA